MKISDTPFLKKKSHLFYQPFQFLWEKLEPPFFSKNFKNNAAKAKSF